MAQPCQKLLSREDYTTSRMTNYTFHEQIRASKESDHSSPRTTQNVLRRK